MSSFQEYVILNGNKTDASRNSIQMVFQEYVILNGNKTESSINKSASIFQEYVILNGFYYPLLCQKKIKEAENQETDEKPCWNMSQI